MSAGENRTVKRKTGEEQKEGKQLLVMATCTNFKVGVTTVMKL